MTGEEILHAAPLVQKLAEPILDALSHSLKWSVDQVRLKLASTFNSHIESSRQKCANVRTINNPDVATPIEQIYVDLYLTAGSETIVDTDILPRLSKGGKIIIIGTAGAGKSMLMRRLFLQSLNLNDNKLSIFLDLRDFKISVGSGVIDNLYRLVVPEKHQHDRELFQKLLDIAGVRLFLDGLDEVSPDDRIDLRENIDDILVKYPKVEVILSSRPDVDFLGWEQFDGLSLNKLLPSQSIEIIEKAVYPDPDIKDQFLTKLRAGEFDQHQSFLNIALLNIILLMCYGEHLQLSEKFSTFYDQAYEVLYRRHDRTKGLRRKHFAGLPADEFKKIVAAFCFRTYADLAYSYTETELTSYLRKACVIAEIDANPEHLAQDMTESVSLLQRDGSKIFFIHRSFQEYFTARFMVDYRGQENYKVFDSILARPQTARISSIVAEIGMQTVEREWVIPTLTPFLSKVSLLGEADKLKALTFIYASISVVSSNGGPFRFNGFSWSETYLAPRLSALSIIYQIPNISEFSLINDTEVLVDGIAFSTYADSTIIPEMKLPVDGGSLIVNEDHKSFQIIQGGRIPTWLDRTVISTRLDEFIVLLKEINDSAKVREQRRIHASVFD